MARLIDKPHLTVDLPTYPKLASGAGGWVLESDWLDNWAWIDGIFSDSELDAIIAMGREIGTSEASTFGGKNKNVRDSFVSFIYPTTLASWVFARLANAINEMNARYFGFDLFAMEQGLQFTEYNAPGEHYDWHIDRGMNSGNRKLSMAMQLTDPSEYEGGELELWLGGQPLPMEKVRGRAFFFPSYVLHRVSPVTHGTRHSLVCWVSGPKFK